MSVPSQGGLFSVGVQASKVGTGAYTPPASFLATRGLNVNVGAVQEQEMIPFQVGGGIVPYGEYKYGEFGVGQVDSVLHADAYMTQLLTLAMGKKTTTVGSKWDDAANAPEAAATTTGVNTHVFEFDSTSDYTLPWFSARVKVPGTTSSDVWGEEAYDSKVSGFSVNIPAAGLLTSQMSFLSRVVRFPLAAAVNAWTTTGSLPDSNSCFTSGAGGGYVKIGSQTPPLVSLGISLVNNLTGPQQEHIIGSHYIDDIVPLSRMIQLRMVLKWNDPAIYRQILTNGPTNVDWSSVPYITNTAAAVKAFDAKFLSGGVIGATTVPYMFKFHAGRVAWRLDQSAIQLRAQDIVMVPLTGTVLAPASGAYAQFALTNDVA